MALQITPEQVEFKELAIGDYCFHGNTFYLKTDERQITSIETDVAKQITGNCLVNIVLNK